jgi:hypothetical protein
MIPVSLHPGKNGTGRNDGIDKRSRVGQCAKTKKFASSEPRKRILLAGPKARRNN